MTEVKQKIDKNALGRQVNEYYDQIINDVMDSNGSIFPIATGSLIPKEADEKMVEKRVNKATVVEKKQVQQRKAVPPPPKDDSIAKTVFEEYDINGDGCIDIKELKHMCVKIGFEVHDQELQAMINAFDADGSGTFGFKEFLSMWDFLGKLGSSGDS